jgi:class 3 adenylate cyclase
MAVWVMAEGRRFMRTTGAWPPDERARLVEDFQRLLRRVLEEHGGRTCTVEGDTVAAAFASVRPAVAAALATRAAVAGHDWPGGLEVSISVGIDESAETCVLICDIAEGGDIFLSAATAALLEDEGLGDVSLCDLGEQPTRRTGENVHVHQLVEPRPA